MLSKLIDEFKSFETNQNEEIKKIDKIAAEYNIILIESTTQYKAINFFKRLFSFEKRKELKKLKEFILDKEIESNKLKVDINNKKQTLNDNYINQLVMADKDSVLKNDEMNKRIQMTTDLYNTIYRTKKAGDNVLHEISEARSAISSAESMETLDMFSKNKGISLMSSMSTSTARSEVNDVGPAIASFKKELEYTRLKVNEVELDSVWTTLDFVFDMSDNGFMDTFSSFMVLNSLGNTDSQLYNIAVTIEKIMQTINKDHTEIKEQLENEKKIREDFFQNFRIQAKIELNSAGIII